MMNNLEININSLCCKALINLVYLFLGIIVTISIIEIIHYSKFFNSFTNYTILIAIPIIVLIEIYRQNKDKWVIVRLYGFI